MRHVICCTQQTIGTLTTESLPLNTELIHDACSYEIMGVALKMFYVQGRRVMPKLFRRPFLSAPVFVAHLCQNLHAAHSASIHMMTTST